MMEVLERGKKTLLEDYDYAQKIRHLDLKKRIEWFVDNKKMMSRCEKWDAFFDMVDDYGIKQDTLIERVNKVIRKRKEEQNGCL